MNSPRDVPVGGDTLFDRQLAGLWEQIQVRQQQLEDLERVRERDGRTSEVDVLRGALAELQIAYEELRVQNETLIASQARIESEHARYHDLFQFSPDAHLITDLDGRILEANRRALATFELLTAELPRPLATLVPLDQRMAFRDRLAALKQSQASAGWTMRMRRRSGAEFPVAILTAYREQRGERPVVHWIVRDVGEETRTADALRALNAELERRVADRTQASLDARQLSEQLLERERESRAHAERAGQRVERLGARYRLLAEASKTLATSLDPQITLQRIARLPLPWLADWCALHLFDATGALNTAVVAHADPERRTAVQHTLEFRGQTPAARGGDGGVLRQGRRWETPTLTELAEVTATPERAEALAALAPRRVLAVPVGLPGRAIGVLVLGCDPLPADASEPLDTEMDLEIAEDYGQRAALALLSARQHLETIESARVERRRAEQLLGAADAALAMDASLSIDVVLDVLTHRSRALLDAGLCVARFVPRDPARPPITSIDLSERISIDGEVGASLMRSPLFDRVVRENVAMRIGAVAMRPGGERYAWLGVPLTDGKGHNLGALQLLDRRPGGFTAEDEAVVVQLAQTASVAIENSILYQQARRAEEDLRRMVEALDERVAERTRELEDKHVEIRRTLEDLDTFSYSVSHNLRAPLRAMQGYASALLEDYGPALDDTAREYARRMITASYRMDTLIQDLLTYARLNRVEPVTSPVDVEQLVRHALRPLAASLEQTGAVVTVDLPERIAVLANIQILSQALGNLIDNAVEYVAAGERPEIVVGARRAGDRVRLWVRDRGIGIAPEHQQRIFRAFERLHGEHDYPGTGIGLAIVQRAVARMGGSVEVESRPGEGSTFTLDLPGAPESDA